MESDEFTSREAVGVERLVKSLLLRDWKLST
jgi:hypothetical protein